MTEALNAALVPLALVAYATIGILTGRYAWRVLGYGGGRQADDARRVVEAAVLWPLALPALLLGARSAERECGKLDEELERHLRSEIAADPAVAEYPEVKAELERLERCKKR